MDVTLAKIRKQVMAGEVRITPETVRQIESLRHTTASPKRTVPLYDFTDMRSA